MLKIVESQPMYDEVGLNLWITNTMYDEVGLKLWIPNPFIMR